jgi:hypothetical protein
MTNKKGAEMNCNEWAALISELFDLQCKASIFISTLLLLTISPNFEECWNPLKINSIVIDFFLDEWLCSSINS